ncbi:hypothetical protein GCM10027596_33030 [Nocardioides korecus]
MNVDDVPTDTYFVAWDGITALVMWDREEETVLPTRSGGHVVIDILTDVLASAGGALYAQPCSPGCTNEFAHRVLRIERAVGPRMVGKVKTHGFPAADIHVHSENEPIGVAGDMMISLRQTAFFFARYKNLARRIQDLESAARSDVDRLLEVQYEQIRRAKLKFGARAREIGKAREERSETKVLVARLWIALARLESFKREWDGMRRRFLESAEESGSLPMFQDDFGDDDHAVDSLDLSFIRAAIEQSASRYDTRVVALATGAGGAAGLVGSMVGALLS